MPRQLQPYRARPAVLLCAVAVLSGACSTQNPTVPAEGDTLALGTWGGDDAGVVVNETAAHVHIGCTLGNFPAPVTFESGGRFNVAGSYVLRAYPVQIGPELPAQFSGRVEGNRLTLTVAVNDTVQKATVQKGPVVVTLGRDPRMGPCPICDKKRSG